MPRDAVDKFMSTIMRSSGQTCVRNVDRQRSSPIYAMIFEGDRALIMIDDNAPNLTRIISWLRAFGVITASYQWDDPHSVPVPRWKEVK